jgi:hypothetical protein
VCGDCCRCFPEAEIARLKSKKSSRNLIDKIDVSVSPTSAVKPTSLAVQLLRKRGEVTGPPDDDNNDVATVATQPESPSHPVALDALEQEVDRVLLSLQEHDTVPTLSSRASLVSSIHALPPVSDEIPTPDKQLESHPMLETLMQRIKSSPRRVQFTVPQATTGRLSASPRARNTPAVAKVPTIDSVSERKIVSPALTGLIRNRLGGLGSPKVAGDTRRLSVSDTKSPLAEVVLSRSGLYHSCCDVVTDRKRCFVSPGRIWTFSGRQYPHRCHARIPIEMIVRTLAP